MASVSSRIKSTKQPRGGYINPKELTVTNLNDGVVLASNENIHSSLVGLVVDYMTRFKMGTPAHIAFSVSLKGAMIAKEDNHARDLVSGISDLDDKSIINACKLVGFDVCFRQGMALYCPVQEIQPDLLTIANIRTMINRSVLFFKQYGPVIKDGFTFEGAYTKLVTSGDGDFLTKDTIFDFKVSENNPISNNTLQLLMYYIMGIHSKHKEFKTIKKIGIFNPRLNNVYILELSKINPSIIEEVSSQVIGY